MTRLRGSGGRLAVALFVAVLLLVGALVATAEGVFSDSTPPRASWLAPRPAQAVQGDLSGSECQVNASDDGSLREVRFYVDGRYLSRDGRAPYTCRWKATPGSGAHTIEARARDSAGNVTTVSRDVTVDKESKASAPPPVPGLKFSGDFEEGLSPPWEGVQHCPEQGQSRVQRTTAPVFQGRFAMEASVRGGCRFGTSSTSARAEIGGAGLDKRYAEGDERYFGHSVYYPRDFPDSQEGFCVNMQLHTRSRGETSSSSALGLSCLDKNSKRVLIRASSNPGCDWQKPMERGVWHHFIWRVKFSANNGSWDLWYRPNGKRSYTKVVKHCAHNALQGPHDYAYWKLGIYRSVRNTDPLTVYHDDARVGTSLESVRR